MKWTSQSAPSRSHVLGGDLQGYNAAMSACEKSLQWQMVLRLLSLELWSWGAADFRERGGIPLWYATKYMDWTRLNILLDGGIEDLTIKEILYICGLIDSTQCIVENETLCSEEKTVGWTFFDQEKRGFWTKRGSKTRNVSFLPLTLR